MLHCLPKYAPRIRVGAFAGVLGLLLALCMVLFPNQVTGAPKPKPGGSGPAAAADADDPGEYEQVVVARRRPENPLLSARSVSVVRREQLAERAPRTTPEALWDAPGVFVQQTNHGGGSPIVRGMVGPQNLILVDGVRLNNSTYRTGPLQYLNLLDPLALERVEVLRGPGSVLYGSDAMGGVIQAFPLEPRHDQLGPFSAGADASLGYSSADHGRTIHAHGELGGAGVSALSGFSYKVLGDLRGGRDIGVQPHSGYEQWNTLGRVSWALPGRHFVGWSVSLTHLFARIIGAGRTDRLLDQRQLQIYDNDDHLLYGRLHGRIPALRTSGDVTVSLQHFFERKDDLRLAADLTAEERAARDETTARTLGVDVMLSSRIWPGRLRLRYGGMWYGDAVDAARFARQAGTPWGDGGRPGYPDGSSYETYGGFVMAEADALRRGPHLLRLAGGYRLHGMTGSAGEAGGMPAVDFSHLGHVATGSVQYRHGRRANVAFTFSQGFRAPNLNEAVLVGDTGKLFHILNPDLGPERVDTFELLVRGRIWRLTAGLTGHVSLLRDVIKREPFDASKHTGTGWTGGTVVDGKPVWLNVNGGRGLLAGLEGSLGVRLSRRLSLTGSLTWTRGTEQVEGGEDVPLTRIPPLFGQATLRYETPRGGGWWGFVETGARGAGAQDQLSAEDLVDPRIPPGGTPGWWTWNTAAGISLWDRAQLGLAVENLLDANYRYHGSGIYGAGTNARITVQGRL